MSRGPASSASGDGVLVGQARGGGALVAHPAEPFRQPLERLARQRDQIEIIDERRGRPSGPALVQDLARGREGGVVVAQAVGRRAQSPS